MSWFAAIFLPQFSLQAALRWNEPAWQQPVAILEGDKEKGHVLEMTESTARSGVWRGMVSTQALARCPALRLLPRAREQEESLTAMLLETAGTLSPFVEATGEGLCIVDLRQVRAGDWEPWAQAVVERLAACELRACVGVAANPDLAALAAAHAEPALVVRDPRTFLAGVSLAKLPVPPEMMTVLRDWGIEHLGELARLPRSALVERLGPMVDVLWEHAAGCAERPLRLVRPPEIFREVFDFEYPVETTEPLLFILRRQLDQLTLRLREVGRVAALMTLTIMLERGPSNTASAESHERVFTIPSPTADAEVLYRILGTYLEALRLAQQPIGVRLRIEPVIAGNAQFGLFESALRDPNHFSETLGRIAALVGTENVGIVQLEDTHQPDRFQLASPTFERLGDRDPATAAESSLLGLPLQRFRPALSAQVRLERGVPRWFSSIADQGAILDAAGPYRGSGDWWQQTGWAIEEWDIELGNGALYRIAQRDGGWLVEGCYQAAVELPV